MATVNELKATARPRAGKGAARAVRREGRVPGVIYGDNQPPIAITLDYDELTHRIMAGRFLTSICNIEIDGKKHRTIPRDFQVDPVRDNPIHVDFLRLGEGATIRVRIPVHVMNVDLSPGVKRGGAVNIVTHHVEVSWRPDWIGDNQVRYLEIDGSKLTIKTAPLISSLSGKQVISILTFERAD